jgi:hypothetical protein
MREGEGVKGVMLSEGEEGVMEGHEERERKWERKNMMLRGGITALMALHYFLIYLSFLPFPFPPYPYLSLPLVPLSSLTPPTIMYAMCIE